MESYQIFTHCIPAFPPPKLDLFIAQTRTHARCDRNKNPAGLLSQQQKNIFVKMEVYKMAGVCYLKTTQLYLNLIIV